MSSILRLKLAESPHALASPAISFYQTIALTASETDILNAILEFSRSPSHQLRAFFVRLAAAVGFCLPLSSFVDCVWPAVLPLSVDRVSSVRAMFLRLAPDFRQHFVSQGLAQVEKHLTTVFMVMGKDPDPLLQTIWREASDRFADTPRRLEHRVSLRDQFLCRSANVLPSPILQKPLRQRPPHVVDLPRKRHGSMQPSRLPLIEDRDGKK
jgi:hypothetical protein